MRMRITLLFVFILFGIQVGFGQILTFEFAGLTGSETSSTSNFNNANLNSSTITRGAGLTASANGDRYNATSWALTSIANAVSGNDYMEFTVTPNSSYQFSISSIVINLQRSAAGPSAIALRSSVDGYGSNLDAVKTIVDNTSTQSFTFTFSQSNSAAAVTYRIYMYAEDVGGSGGPGDFSGNDIIVNGTVSASAITSTTSGDWNVGTTWVGGVAPTATDNVIIANGHVVTNTTAITRNAGTTTTVNAGGTLATNANYTNSGTTTINGTFQVNGGGYANTNAFVYAATGSTLIMNHNSGLYGISTGQAFWPTSNPPFNVTIQGTGAQINNTVGAVAGTLNVNAQLVVATANALTVNGTMRLNAGGYIGSGNAPIYGSSSLLVYNSGGNFNRGTEWTGATSGAGFPNNVQLSTSGTIFNMGGPSNAYCGGYVLIDAATTLNNQTSVLNVAGNVTINGTLNLGEDIKTAGNWTVAAAGTQTNNGKAVFFNGATGTQSIVKTGGGNVFFDYLILDKATGTTQISSSPATNIIINTTSGDFLQLINAGTFDLNGRTLTLNNNNGNISTNAAGRTITSSVSGATIAVTGYKNVTGTGTLILDTNVTTILTAGLDFGTSKTTVNGALQINTNGFANTSPIYGSASTLIYNAVTAYGVGNEWTGNATNAGLGIPKNVTIQAAASVNMPAGARGLAGNLTINNGTLSLNAGANNDLYINGNISFTSYTFNPNNKALFFTNNAVVQTISADATPTFHYVVFPATSGTTTVQLVGTNLNITAPSGGNTINFGTLANVFDLNGRTLTLGTALQNNTISGTSGTFKGSTTSNMTLLGSGSIGTLRFTTASQVLGTLTITRTNGQIGAVLGTNLSINGLLQLNSGLLDLGSSILTITPNTAIGGTPSANNFIIADGGGELRKVFTGTGSYLFPIGDNTSGLDYSPVELNFTSGSFASAYAGVKVTDVQHPNNTATTNYITRYWSVTSSGITSPVYDFDGTFINSASDVNGTMTLSDAGRWNGTSWTVGSPLTTNVVSLDGLTTLPTTNQFTAGNPLSANEINITGNSVSIVNNDNSPSLADHTDFGSAAYGNTIVRTFTIQNTGGSALALLGSPRVQLSGSSAFSVTAQPSSATIAASGSLTFQITYTSGSFSAENAMVTISNSDGDEGTYTFAITGIATPSATSDIIASSGYSYNSNIAYATYQASTISNTGSGVNGSIDLFRFDIRDGGASADADALPTILNAITFNITNSTMIRSAALFNGNALVSATPTINTGSGTIAFSNLSAIATPANVTAADNGTNSLTLRVSFTATVTDNTQFQVTIANANVATSGSNASSLFGSFTSVVSSTTSDRNRIEVTADRLAFVQQPTNTSVNAAMSPAVTVSANDANANRDLDFATAITITSTGTLTGTSVSGSVSGGLATFSTLTHTVTQTGRTLTALTSGLADNDVVSNSFDILAIIYVYGDYRTLTAGTWTDTSGEGTATWEKFTTGWAAVPGESPSTTDINVYITKNIEVPTFASSYGGAKVIVSDNATLTFNSSNLWTFRNIIIKSDGNIEMRTRFTVLSTGNFEIEDGGNFIYNYSANSGASTSLTSTLWAGIEIFHPSSNFIIKNHETGSSNYLLPADSNISSNNFNGVTAYFGNLIIESTSEVRMTTTNFNNKTLTHGNLEIKPASNYALIYGSVNWTIGGDLLINQNSASASSSTLTFTTGSNTVVLNVKGDIINNSKHLVRLLNNATGNFTVNVDGDIQMTDEGKLDLNFTSGGVSTINLKGDLLVTANGLLTSTANSVSTFNFTGTGDGLSAATTQTVDIATTATSENKSINFATKVLSGSIPYVQLANNNLELGNGGSFTVGSGSTLDFGFTGSSPLLLKEVPAGATTTSFSLASGGTIKITSPYGVTTATTGATAGNVELDSRTFTQGGSTFHYIGKANQVTGDIFTVGSTSKRVICDLDTTSLQLTLNNSTQTSNELYIKKGIFIETEAANIGGGGNLTMDTDGTYRTAVTSANLPQLTGTYSLNGNSTIELNASANQVLKGSRAYRNLTFSNSGTKTLTSAPSSITGTITVSGSAILDVSGQSMGGSGTNLTMTGTSQYINGKAGTLPDATGTYNLAATSTIEFNGTAASEIRLSPTYGKIIVSGSNVSKTSTTTALKFAVGGSFTVENGGVFKFLNTAGFNGSNTSAIDNTNSPTITLESDSTVEYAGANQFLTAVAGGYGNMAISGSGLKTISASGEVLVGNELSITASTLQIENNKLLTVENDIINTSGNALVINNGGNLVQLNNVDNATANTNDGNIQMTRTTRSLDAEDYVYWGSPVMEDVSAQIPSAYDASYMWDVDGSMEGVWNGISSTVPGRGFITRVASGSEGVRNFDFTGKPNNGFVYVDALNWNGGTDETGNTILLANPYPSAIDAGEFVSLNPTINGTLYFWTAITPMVDGEYDTDDYATWNLTGFTSPNDLSGSSDLEPTGKIGAGQGFFAEMNSDGTIEFNNDMRVRTTGDNMQFFRSGIVERNRIWLKLTNANGAYRQALVGYIQGATNGIDRLYDGNSITGNEINLYSIENSKKLAIQGRALPFENTDVVPLGYAITTAGEYTIAIDKLDGLFLDGQAIYLEDLLLNVTHDLNASSYTFNTESGTFENRFLLRYTNAPLGLNPIDEIENQVTVATENQILKIKSDIENIQSILIFDLLGRKVFDKTAINAPEFYAEDVVLNQQALIVKIELTNGQTITRKIVF